MTKEGSGPGNLLPPIVGVETGTDVTLFRSLRTAGIGIEHYDVDDFEMFDARGQILAMVVKGNSVEVRSDADSPIESDRLADILRGFIQAVGYERISIKNVSDASLPELVDALKDFMGLE